MSDLAQAKFEKEKEQVLKSLPDTFKKTFGVIGFCKHEPDEDEEENANANAGEEYIPCLILGPYSIPPRPFRDVYWWDYYSKAKRTKKLGEMEYLVYHYGATDNNDCYSFITQENFKSYEDGLAEGLDKLPASLQAKVDAGEELTEEEQVRVNGLKEIKEDVDKAPEDRKRGNWQFKERHEVMREKEACGPSPPKRQKKK